MGGRLASLDSKGQLREQRSNSISNAILLDNKSAEGGEQMKPGQLNGNCGIQRATGTHSITKAKADLINTRDSFSSVGGSGREGQSNDSKVVSLLGQGTSTLQSMQNPQKVDEFKMGSLACSDGKATGKAGSTPKD